MTELSTETIAAVDIDALFAAAVVVPATVAKFKIKIGKRTRSFDDTDEGKAKAREALESFNNPKSAPTGAMAAFRENAAEMRVLCALAGRCIESLGLEGRVKAGKINTLAVFLKDEPECVKVLEVKYPATTPESVGLYADEPQTAEELIAEAGAGDSDPLAGLGTDMDRGALGDEGPVTDPLAGLL